MAKVKIVHAVGDYDLNVGDSNGEEIIFTNWYNRTGGWKDLLYCTDEKMASKAANYAKLIANNNSYGYSQDAGSNGRWSGYKSIKALITLHGYSVEDAIAKGKGNFDCSSLVIGAYILAGLNHKMSGYTGSMVKSLMATGKFEHITDDIYLKSEAYAKVGALYVAPNAHVAMAVTNGTKKPEKDMGYVGTVTALGSVRVRNKPVTGKTLQILSKGETAGIISVDSITGWYYVQTDKCVGYMTSNERYVKKS